MLLSVVLYSCCPEQVFQIRSFNQLQIFDLNTQSPQENPDIVTDEFVIIATFSSENAPISNFHFDITTSAYATSCDNDTFLNELNEESFSISLDKGFIYNGDTIAANSNLTEIIAINDNIIFFYDIIEVSFLNDFLNIAEFENQEYTFTLYIESSDGLQFEKQISTTFEL